MRNINVTILEILKTSKDIGKNKMEIQNIDHLIGRKGEREYVGAILIDKLEELINQGLIQKQNDYFSITEQGINYLSENSKE